MATKRALVVGINNYGGPPNDLPSCIADADAFTALLRGKYGFRDIRVLRDGEATSERLNAELGWLTRSAKSGDSLVFYFSGHGYTKIVGGQLEEFLVLSGPELYQDDVLVRSTRSLPPGVLTTILDSCFSGGMRKAVLDLSGDSPTIEAAHVKVWKAPPEQAAKDFGFADDATTNEATAVTALKRFGMPRITSVNAMAKSLRLPAGVTAPSAREVGPASKAPASEEGQPELNGLLVSACREDETAAASTSKTEGLSAFTHAMVRAVGGASAASNRSAEQVFAATASALKAGGFEQTPTLFESAKPGDLKARGFLTLSTVAASSTPAPQPTAPPSTRPAPTGGFDLAALIADVLRGLPSMPPSPSQPVPGKDLTMSTLAMPMTAANPVADDEQQKIFGAILGALAPIAVQVAGQLLRGRRKSADLGDLGSPPDAESTTVTGDEQEEQQKIFGAILAAVAPTVIRAVAPHVVRLVRGGRKAADFGVESTDTGTGSEAEEQQKIFGAIVAAVAPAIMRAVAPHVARFVRGGRKAADFSAFAMDDGAGKALAPEDAEEQQKIFGAILGALAPIAVQVAGQLLRGRRKSADLGDLGSLSDATSGTASSAIAGSDEEEQEKIFGEILRTVAPAVIRAVAPHVVRLVRGGHKAADFSALAMDDGAGKALAPEDEAEQQKIFGAILGTLAPVAVQVARQLLRTRRKEIADAHADSSVEAFLTVTAATSAGRFAAAGASI